MKKRLLSLLLVGAMAASMLVGCGAKEEAQAPAETEVTEDVKDTDVTAVADTAVLVEEVAEQAKIAGYNQETFMELQKIINEFLDVIDFKLCSITKTVSPLSTILFKIESNFSIS